ncbi:MAG: cytochrome P450 [Cyanobacteria bacterium HKST-UBA03]|nr:cytochrome P450 [Cyanobacteria bacterium HKST-UBA03]
MNAHPICDDLMTPEVMGDPHTYYRHLREQDPVHWNERWGGWILTRYTEVLQALTDADTFSSNRMASLEQELGACGRAQYAPIFDMVGNWAVFLDPPDHTRIRRLLNNRFSPMSVEQYRPRVRAIVKKLLADLDGRDSFDMVRDFAYLVPLTVILELLGAPALDRDLIKHWSEQIGTFFFIRADEPRRREIACEGITAFAEYLRPLIEERRENPQLDLISALVGAEEQGNLSTDEVVATAMLMVFGGHETTMNLIANGTLALIEHPAEWMRLKEQPELMETAVEEFLRYDGSVKTTVRWAKQDVVLGDKTIKAGDRLLLGLSAANRDPAQFENPDTLDLARDPNPHLAFGYGIHICLGAPLARLEAQEAFKALTQNYPPPRLAADELEYHPAVIGRALKTLPVTFK